jgi:hypothetical protein
MGDGPRLQRRVPAPPPGRQGVVLRNGDFIHADRIELVAAGAPEGGVPEEWQVVVTSVLFGRQQFLARRDLMALIRPVPSK